MRHCGHPLEAELEHERTGQEAHGTPFLSENEGHVLDSSQVSRSDNVNPHRDLLLVGSAGQQAPSPKLGTLPSAALALEPDQLESEAPETLW